MAVKLDDLKQEVTTLPVPIRDQTITIGYKSFAFTPKFEELMQSELHLTTASVLRARFRDTLVFWDLLDKDGEPIPVTNETLAETPTYILLAILEEINEDQIPKKAKPSASRSSFKAGPD